MDGKFKYPGKGVSHMWDAISKGGWSWEDIWLENMGQWRFMNNFSAASYVPKSVILNNNLYKNEEKSYIILHVDVKDNRIRGILSVRCYVCTSQVELPNQT